MPAHVLSSFEVYCHIYVKKSLFKRCIKWEYLHFQWHHFRWVQRQKMPHHVNVLWNELRTVLPQKGIYRTNTPFQHSRIIHPKTPYQHTLLNHPPLNTHYQSTLSIHSANSPFSQPITKRYPLSWLDMERKIATFNAIRSGAREVLSLPSSSSSSPSSLLSPDDPRHRSRYLSRGTGIATAVSAAEVTTTASPSSQKTATAAVVTTTSASSYSKKAASAAGEAVVTGNIQVSLDENKNPQQQQQQRGRRVINIIVYSR